MTFRTARTAVLWALLVHLSIRLRFLAEIGEIVHRNPSKTRGARSYLIDAMSSFGGIPLDMNRAKADFVVSSANKCIQGVPGFGFILAKRSAIAATAGWSRTLSLDVCAQWKGLEANGQFRFTPPTHSLLAFRQALTELDQEGGVAARYKRYSENQRIIARGFKDMGFSLLLDDAVQGPIITSVYYPKSERFKFDDFYNKLYNRGIVIYPGKVAQADCFRIGSIGHLFPDDMRLLLSHVKEIKAEMAF